MSLQAMTERRGAAIKDPTPERDSSTESSDDGRDMIQVEPEAAPFESKYTPSEDDQREDLAEEGVKPTSSDAKDAGEIQKSDPEETNALALVANPEESKPVVTPCDETGK